MAKRIDYGKLFTLRSDGRYTTSYLDGSGKRRWLYDRDPANLYRRLEEAKQPRPITFKSAAESWYSDHSERVGYKTVEAYKAPIARLTERFGGSELASVTPQQIQAFLSELGKRGYARRTVQMHRDILNMIYNHAIVQGTAHTNPCGAVSVPKGLHTTRREIPSDAALEAVRASSGEMALFAKLCLYAGLRKGEVLALTYEDIDRENRVIHVTKAVEFIKNDPHLKTTKTAAGYRDVILLDVLAAEIPQGKHGLLLSMDDGKMLTKTSFFKRWRTYCKTIGFDISPHQLRHGYATILFEAGISDKDAQELLGHSTIAVTRDIYTHIRQSRREETAARLNAFVNR